MALEGTIRDFGLADIFQLIGLQKKTGTLFLKGPDGTVNIHFEDGMVVKTEDSQLAARNHLGKILINRGKISEQDLQNALEIQQSTAQRLGYVLIGQGLVNREDLRDALAFQMSEIIYKVFRWRGGDYKFYQDKVDYERELIGPISSEHILMDGIRMLDEWPLIEKKLPAEGVVLKRSARMMGFELDAADAEPADIFTDEEAPRAKPGLSRDAMSVLGLVDGARSILEVIELSPVGKFDTSKSLVELLDKGYIVKTDSTPHILVAQKPVQAERKKVEPSLGMLPYVFAVIAVAVILFQVTGTREIMDARSEGLLVLKTPFAVNHIEKVYENTQLFYMDYGKYPESAKALQEHGYFDASDVMDPWGSELVLSFNPNGSVLVTSAGPDRTLNTADDLTSRP